MGKTWLRIKKTEKWITQKLQLVEFEVVHVHVYEHWEFQTSPWSSKQNKKYTKLPVNMDTSQNYTKLHCKHGHITKLYQTSLKTWTHYKKYWWIKMNLQALKEPDLTKYLYVDTSQKHNSKNNWEQDINRAA